MDKKQFSIYIAASPEKVWNALWEDQNYRKWTSAFHAGSYAESTWNEGAGIRFLTPEGSGMYSKIEKMEEPEVMSFRHLGVVKEGVNQPLDEEAKKWAGGIEEYTLMPEGDGTQLQVEVDVYEDFQTYFEETFPKALQLVKEIAEGGKEA